MEFAEAKIMLLFLTLLAIVLLMQCFAWIVGRSLCQSICRGCGLVDGRKLSFSVLILASLHRLCCTLQPFWAPPDVPWQDHCQPIFTRATGPFLPLGRVNIPSAQHENDLSFFQLYDWVVQSK